MPNERVVPNHFWLNSQSGATTARPSVVTASVSPGTRSAGRPTRTIRPAPTNPHTMTSSGIDHPCRMRWAATNAPAPTRANWPRLTWPAQPMAIVNDNDTTT